MGRVTSWLQDAAVKIGPILPSPMTSSMRDFGASRDERRPDVRFCGLGVAVEEWARADWRSVNGMVRRYADHVA